MPPSLSIVTLLFRMKECMVHGTPRQFPPKFSLALPTGRPHAQPRARSPSLLSNMDWLSKPQQQPSPNGQPLTPATAANGATRWAQPRRPAGPLSALLPFSCTVQGCERGRGCGGEPLVQAPTRRPAGLPLKPLLGPGHHTFNLISCCLAGAAGRVSPRTSTP